MFKLRNLLMILGISAALLIPFADAYARGGGGRGGGGGGGGRGGGGGGGRGGGGGGGGGGGAAAQPQVNPVIAADRAQVTTNQSALNAANLSYTNAVTDFTTTFMKTPDYAAAQKGVDDATKELDAARAAVIAKLKANDTAYKAAVQKEADAKKKLDQIRANGGNRDAISAQAQAILDAGDAVTKIENDALAKDIPYQDAKKKLAAANDKLKAQKDALADAIKNDEKLTGLKTAVDTAKTALADSQTKLKADGG